MNIYFKRVHLVNFLSFGDSEIVLNDNGYTLVKGENNNIDDLATSNGSGKSSIWEAIAWALTGDTIRGTKNVVNMHTNEGTYVELEFDIDNNNYKIVRSKDHKVFKTNLKIYINGEDKSGKGIRDSEKLLSEYLPDLTSSLIGSVIILGQGLPQRFSNNTPSGRKEVLEKLSKSDFMISDLKTRISERKKVLSDKLRQVEDDILRLTTEKSMVEKLVIEDKQKLSNMGNLDAMIMELGFLNHDLKKLENEYNLLEDELNQNTQILNNYNEELLKLNNKYTEQINTVFQHEDYIRYNDISKVIMEKEMELNSIKSEIVKLDSIKDVCPTCGQKLQGVEKPDTTELKNQYNLILSEIEELKQSKSDAEKSYTEYKNNINAEFNDKVSANKRCISESNIIITKLKNDMSIKHNEMESTKNSIIIADKNIQNYSEQLNELNGKISHNEGVLVDLSEKISYNNNMKDDMERRLAVINKMNTIITRDFRGYLLQNSIEFIDRKAKEYSKEVFDTDKLDFKLDGNSISISYDGKEYENLSGGERAKCDIIVQLAIRDMLCKHVGFSSNILVLDEIFDSLDYKGCNRILNLITKKVSDVQSIFIITHHQDLQIPCDHEITVVKNSNKISNVVQK